MQVRFWWLAFLTTWLVLQEPDRGVTEIDRFGETERSTENRIEGAEVADEPQRLTRVGEVERWKKVVEREEKLELEEAKAVEEHEGDE